MSSAYSAVASPAAVCVSHDLHTKESYMYTHI